MARPLPIRPQLLHPPPDESESVPFTISGLIGAWFADDLRASLADAAAVSSWADASGNGNTLSNTGTNRPTFDYTNPQFNGHASVNFVKASTQSLYGESVPICTALSGADKPFTVFVVARRSTKVSANECIVGFGNAATGTASAMQLQWRYASSNSQRQGFVATDDVPASATLSGLSELMDLSAQVLCWSLSGATYSGYIAGASQNQLYDAAANNVASGDYSSLGTFTFDRFSIGALVRNTTTIPCDCEVACVLVYNRELNEADRVRIVEHLWNKYVPRVITGAANIPNLAHHWDASLLSGAAGSDVNTWEDQVGTIDFDATGFDAPVVALHENGSKVVYFQGTDDAMDSANASDGNFLHNDSTSTFGIVYRVEAADAITNPILDTNGNSATARGFSLVHDGASAAHSLQIKIGNGTTNVLNHDSQDYGDRPGVWHAAVVVHQATVPSTEEEYHIWLDNEHYASADAANAESASDAAGPITLGKLSGVATFGKIKIAEIVHYSRALGPNETKLLLEHWARKWQTAHAALAAGNGLANTANDTNKHRGFPALCQGENGTWHCVYRRGPDHGASRGVGIQVTSADGIRWSPEKVIYDVDDADGRDFRGGCSLIRLRHGTHAGRMLMATNWATDTSGLEVAGFGSTNLLGISDDSGGSWTWSNPQENDPKNVYETPWDYTVANAGCLIELSTGRILMTFTSKDAGQDSDNQDLNLCYSDNGGETWSDSVIIALHDVCFNNQLNKRITESWIIEWDDGELTMFVRNDTDKEIWRATADITNVTTWTFDATKLFDGFGRPMAFRDPNDAEACYMIFRSDPGLLTVWRYSADRGATWSAADIAFSNLHATTTIADYGEMSYSYAAADADGNIWVASGLEEQDDSDIFVRRWVNAE